jgi:glycosyltransferase involved in cell wall biosynthesis
VLHSDNPSTSNAFEISVVIPALNEEASIRQLLEDLLSQTLEPAEIVITDGGSTDQTREIIEEFIAAGAPVKLVRVEKSMPGRARNLAVAQSCCQWIAFTDAGITLTPEWLEALKTKASEDSADVVYGTYEPIIDSFFTQCAAIAYVPPPFESDGGPVRPRSIVSALMRRQAWETVGGFPEHLRSAEDLLFMTQVEQSGFRIARTSRARVYWHMQPNFWRTFRRFVEYSRNNIRAGLFSEWQQTIFLYYALIAATTFGVIFMGPRGLIIPPVAWLLLLIARAAKTLYQNRQTYPAGFGPNLARLVLLVPIIATLDAAAFIGSVNWLLRDQLGLIGTR